MAMLAEVVKNTPYAKATDLDAISGMVKPQADRDAYRTELVDLLEHYRTLR